jgi:hypothetical protein
LHDGTSTFHQWSDHNNTIGCSIDGFHWSMTTPEFVAKDPYFVIDNGLSGERKLRHFALWSDHLYLGPDKKRPRSRLTKT